MHRSVYFVAILILVLLCRGGAAAQTADFSFTPKSGCAPLLVNFTSLSTGVINIYAWDLGNGTTAATASPSTTYSTPGTYIVTLTVIGPGGSSVKTDTVTVYGGPAISFNAGTLSGCSPLGTQFSLTATANAPGPLRYSWAFGDGTTDTAKDPLHTYNQGGTFRVSVTATNGAGCNSIAVRNSYITAWDLPKLNFVADQSQHCGSPATIRFTAGVTSGLGPFTYAWDFGDNTTGTGPTPSHGYTGGSYTVEGIVTDSRGCKDTTRIPNYVFVLGTSPSFTTKNVCVDSVMSFTNTTGTGGKAIWDFGDGTTDSGNFKTHTYKTAGQFTVRMTLRIGNCPKTALQTITVYPAPTTTLTMSPSVPCPATQTLTFTATSDIPATYAWSWLTGGTATGPVVTKTYTKTEEDNLEVLATSAMGCQRRTSLDTIMVREIYQRLFTVRRFNDDKRIWGGCAPYTMEMAPIEVLTNFPSAQPPDRFYPIGVTSYRWDFGDGGVSNQPVPSHTYPNPGTYKIRSIITTANGCVDTAFDSVVVTASVLPSFTLADDSICIREKFLAYNTTANPPPGLIYVWDAVGFPKGMPLNGRFDTSLLMSNTNEAFYVTLITWNKDCDTSARRLMHVNPPSALFSYETECWPSLKATFIDKSVGADTYLWNFADGSSDTGRSPVHVYDTPGRYLPQLITYNPRYGCRDTFTLPYANAVHFRSPDFRPSVSNPIACTGRPVMVRTVYPYTTDDPYPWAISIAAGGDTSAFDGNGEISYVTLNKTGTYDLVLFYRYGGKVCYDTVVLPAAIRISKPVVNFGADITQGCSPLTVLLQDSSTNEIPTVKNNAYNWDFGDRDSSWVFDSVISVLHNYDSTGRFTVRLFVTDEAGCADSLERPLYIRVHKTVAAFDSLAQGAGPDAACLGVPIRFRSASTGLTALRLHWDFGDGDTDTAIAPLHTYTQRGQYTLRLIATDSIGCADTVVRQLPITVSMPTAAFALSSDVAICAPLQISTTNSSTGASAYRWNFGNGNPGTIVIDTPTETFDRPGIFRVTLIATDAAGCADTAFDSVRVLGYNGAFRFTPPTGCLPLEVTFTPDVAAIPILTWDFGDGFTDTSRNSAPASHRYTRPGAFLPKVIFSDGQDCPGSLSAALDSVYVDQVSADFTWSVPCAATPFTLTQTSTAVYGMPNTFRWSSPVAGAAAGSPAAMTFPASGTYPLTLVASNAAGCADTITKDVLIHALPPVWAGTDTAVCPGDTARLLASGARSYTWAVSPRTPGAGLGCVTCPESYGWIFGDAVYTLSGVDANGCVGRDSVTVSIQLKTTSTTGPGGAICYGDTFRLSAAGADVYLWSPAESLDDPTAAAPVARPKSTTTYMVISREGSCQVDTQRIPVVVHPLPQFSAGADKIISLGSVATLEPRGDFSSIEWLDADTTLSCHDCRNPNAGPAFTRTYRAKATNAWGCEATDSVTVHVRCNGSQVFVPNTFTPNGDGQNDRFFPQGAGLDRMASFRVFNRWGELVFEALNVELNSAASGWDGTFKGQALAPDTYVYTMSSRCRTGEVVSFKGDITLVR